MHQPVPSERRHSQYGPGRQNFKEARLTWNGSAGCGSCGGGSGAREQRRGQDVTGQRRESESPRKEDRQAQFPPRKKIVRVKSIA